MLALCGAGRAFTAMAGLLTALLPHGLMSGPMAVNFHGAHDPDLLPAVFLINFFHFSGNFTVSSGNWLTVAVDIFGSPFCRREKAEEPLSGLFCNLQHMKFYLA